MIEEKLDHTKFKFESAKYSSLNRRVDNTFLRILLVANQAIFFEVGKNTSGRITKNHLSISFFPHSLEEKGEKEVDSIESTLKTLRYWCKLLKRDDEISNNWNRYVEKITISDSTDNELEDEKFSKTEIKLIAGELETLKIKLIENNVPKTATDKIDKLIGDLEVSNKFDWRELALGTIINIAITYGPSTIPYIKAFFNFISNTVRLIPNINF